MVARENGVVALEKRVVARQKRVAAFDAGEVAPETGVLLERGVLASETGGSLERDVLALDRCVVARVAGAATGEARASRGCNCKDDSGTRVSAFRSGSLCVVRMA